MEKVDSLTYFRKVTEEAKKLVQAEQSGEPISDDESDFELACAECKELIEPPKKNFTCSACKAPIYCSAQCAKRHWKKTPFAHKSLCSDNKRHMQRLPATQAIVKSFPWGRLEIDGTFSVDLARGRFDVLGGSGYGYWSHKGGPAPHSVGSIDIDKIAATTPYAQLMRKMIKSFDHLDGKDLLKTEQLSDEQGWKLPLEYIPYRDFTHKDDRRPVLATEFDGGIVDWDSWYRWRKIPKDSPAALLMDFPMSVYRMLVHCLKVTSPGAGSAAKRVKLNIHLLGVEVELNFVPLFSELALLLPYHDIQATFLGPGTQRLLDEAKKHPSSIAMKCFSSPPSPIFTYSAPPECGSSTISIYLSTTTIWNPYTLQIPDALVACNAGLGSYQEWTYVMRGAIVMRIPFASTEYTEQSAEYQRSIIPDILEGTGVKVPKDLTADHPIELNPFHRPGQRTIPMYRLPNLVNGFTLVVHRKPASEGKGKKNELEADMKRLSLDID